MIEHSNEFRQGIRFEFVRTQTSLGFDEFELRLLGDQNYVLMKLKLPKHIIQEIIGAADEPIITMSPDGLIGVYADGQNEPASSMSIALDKLVSQNIAPDMLNGEDHLPEQLNVLRERLRASLDDVEATINALPKQPI